MKMVGLNLEALASARRATLALAIVFAWAGCEGSSLEDREEGELMGPVTDEVHDREVGEGTELRRAEKNVVLPEVKAKCVLRPTEGNETSGELELGPAEQGVQVVGSVSGLRPSGIHAIHVHEKGDCSAPDASSAGGHFNPTDERHGRRHHGEHHVGDMDNLKADVDGTAPVEQIVVGATLGEGGERDIAGKSIIVHLRPDDYQSQPAGDAGERIACGVIELITEP